VLLTRVRDEIKREGRISLKALALRMRHEPALVRDLVTVWCRKGRVKALPTGERCGGCVLCETEALEFYEWVGCWTGEAEASGEPASCASQASVSDVQGGPDTKAPDELKEA